MGLGASQSRRLLVSSALSASLALVYLAKTSSQEQQKDSQLQLQLPKSQPLALQPVAARVPTTRDDPRNVIDEVWLAFD